MSAHEEQIRSNQLRRSLRVGDWLWRPLYAKLWWAAVPLYWIGMGAGLYSEAVAEFYNSALAGYLTIFFFPPMVALILCFGFFRVCLAVHSNGDNHTDCSGEMFLGADTHGPSGMSCEFDPLDSRSGVFWIGNPLNPTHPSNINRVS